MTAKKFIRKLPHLKGLRIVAFEFKAKDLLLWVKPFKNGCRCPACKRRGSIVRIMDEHRIWRDIPLCRWTVVFC